MPSYRKLSQTGGTQDPLLSSFTETLSDEDEGSSSDSSKNSDDRLRSHNSEMDGIGRTIQESVNTATATAAAAASSSSAGDQGQGSDQQQDTTTGSRGAQESTSSSSQFSIHSISNNFNFLDRVFKSKSTGNTSSFDGVFSNMSAKPDSEPRVESDKPPTYEEAAADSTPPYWENSILAPGFAEEVFVDGLPVGNIVNFIWNLLVSSSFQFVGFLLTYILHTSHAAKQGSRAGLGVTFMTNGYYMLPSKSSIGNGNDALASDRVEPTSPNDYNVKGDNNIQGSLDEFHSTLSSGTDFSSGETNNGQTWLVACVVFAFGGFLFVKALVDYQRARKMEQVILAPPTNLPPQPEDIV